MRRLGLSNPKNKRQTNKLSKPSTITNLVIRVSCDGTNRMKSWLWTMQNSTDKTKNTECFVFR